MLVSRGRPRRGDHSPRVRSEQGGRRGTVGERARGGQLSSLRRARLAKSGRRTTPHPAGGISPSISRLDVPAPSSRAHRPKDDSKGLQAADTTLTCDDDEHCSCRALLRPVDRHQPPFPQLPSCHLLAAQHVVDSRCRCRHPNRSRPRRHLHRRLLLDPGRALPGQPPAKVPRHGRRSPAQERDRACPARDQAAVGGPVVRGPRRAVRGDPARAPDRDGQCRPARAEDGDEPDRSVLLRAAGNVLLLPSWWTAGTGTAAVRRRLEPASDGRDVSPTPFSPRRPPCPCSLPAPLPFRVAAADADSSPAPARRSRRVRPHGIDW